MSFVVEFHGDPYGTDEDVTSLVAWLEDDDRLRGHAEIRMKPPAPGEMGGLADAAKITLGAVAPLAKALGTWLLDRVRNKGPVKMSVTREGHGSFALEANSVADIERLLPQMRAFFAED